MTKEEKIARYSKLNQEVVPGKIAMANKAVQELAERHHAKYIDINDPLKDRDGNLKAEYTIEGMHIKEEGYRAIFDLFMVCKRATMERLKYSLSCMQVIKMHSLLLPL